MSLAIPSQVKYDIIVIIQKTIITWCKHFYCCLFSSSLIGICNFVPLLPNQSNGTRKFCTEQNSAHQAFHITDNNWLTKNSVQYSASSCFYPEWWTTLWQNALFILINWYRKNYELSCLICLIFEVLKCFWSYSIVWQFLVIVSSQVHCSNQ